MRRIIFDFFKKYILAVNGHDASKAFLILGGKG